METVGNNTEERNITASRSVETASDKPEVLDQPVRNATVELLWMLLENCEVEMQKKKEPLKRGARTTPRQKKKVSESVMTPLKIQQSHRSFEISLSQPSVFHCTLALLRNPSSSSTVIACY